MELKDFIRDTLVGIASGIQEAKLATYDIWAINPGSMNGKRVIEKSFVEFDIAVTVREVGSIQKDGKASVKAEIAVMGAKLGGALSGGGAETEQTIEENASRVSFKVPVHMNAHYREDEKIMQEAEHYRGRVRNELRADR